MYTNIHATTLEYYCTHAPMYEHISAFICRYPKILVC